MREAESRSTTTTTTSTRGRILDSALAGFARRGVSATSLDDVAADVGVRKQTILYWFASKDILVRGVVDLAVDEVSKALSEAARTRRPERDPAATVIDAVLRLGARRPDLLVLLREVARLGPPVSMWLAGSLEGPITEAARTLAGPTGDEEAARRAVVEIGARVVATAVEVELLRSLGVDPGRAWLRRRRRELLALLPDSVSRF